MKSEVASEQRGRPAEYGADVTAALAIVWDACGCPCAENMPRDSMDEHIAALAVEKQWPISQEVTDSLLRMSTATKKRRIALMRTKRGMLRGRSSTTPSKLKGIIPIRKSHTWVGLPPGHLQTDTVVHCGDRLTDDVVYSVGCVDFATYWSEYAAQWNKGKEVTQESLATLRARFPFSWKELHPDSGDEFINYHLHSWATQESIEMTRSEPYKKNDNMCIEERNNTIPRKHLGHVRMDAVSLVPLCAEVLRVACRLHNHFRPVRRMTDKVRIGSQWKRTFEKTAQTPYQRVLLSTTISDETKTALRAAHAGLNPIALTRELARLQAELARVLARKADYQPKK